MNNPNDQHIKLPKLKLSERLKKFRKDHNLTQYDMARAIEVHINTYRLWEMDVSTPNDDNLSMINQAMNDIIKGEWDDVSAKSMLRNLEGE